MSFAFLAVIALAALLVTPIFVVAARREARWRAGALPAAKSPASSPVGAKLTALRAQTVAAAPRNAGDAAGPGPDPKLWAPAVKQALAWSRAKQHKA